MNEMLEPWQMNALLTLLVRKLGHSYQDQNLFFQSLTHTSFAHENNKHELSNERLEFLGDSVLSLIITEKLMELFPDKKEGELSKMRSALVNEETLYRFSQFLNLGEALFLGKGEEKSGGRTKKRNLARVFEAVLGGIYLDSNYKTAKKFLLDFITTFEKENEKMFSEKILESFDPKTKLQEEVLKRFKQPPKYESIDLENQSYEVQLWIEGECVGKAHGNSKKQIEKILAIQALKEKSYLQGEQNAS